MSTSTEAKALSKGASEGQKDDVFAMWRTRKESFNSPALKPDLSGRRKSNLKDLTTHLSAMRAVPGMRRMTISMRAKSDISADMLKPQVKKENTYKMTPDDEKGFSVAKVTKAVNELFEDELQDVVYSHDTSSKLSLEISEKVKEKVKELNFARFKISVNVIIGQVADQEMEVASRCVWDEKFDRSACVTFKNRSMFVIAMIFGTYFE